MNRLLSFVVAASAAAAAPVFMGACVGAGASSASLGSVSSLSASSMSAAAEENHHHYASDVRAAVRSALASDASEAEILRSVGRVAKRHGVSDWEVQMATYVAIGEAIRLAGNDESTAIALAPGLAGGNDEAVKLLLEGYRST